MCQFKFACWNLCFVFSHTKSSCVTNLINSCWDKLITGRYRRVYVVVASVRHVVCALVIIGGDLQPGVTMETSYQGGVAQEGGSDNFQRLSSTIASNIKKISQNGMANSSKHSLERILLSIGLSMSGICSRNNSLCNVLICLYFKHTMM